MKTQDSVDILAPPSQPQRSRKGMRFATLGAILVVALIVGASAVVFAQLSQQHKNAAQPPSGTWVSVLQGYTISSLAAAHNSPAVLYACATQTQSTSQPSSNNINYTVLRSTDFGTHWQDVGSKAALGQSCQLAINPTDSNDIFVVGTSTGTGGQATATLLHSTDGGQTWTTIHPGLKLSSSYTVPQWNIQELSFAGNALFGLQSLSPRTGSTNRPNGVPRFLSQLSRLLTSTDGGQTWTVVDQQMTTQNLSSSFYAVDPTNSKTIYELVGTPWWPVQPRTTEPNDVIPGFITNGDVYQTTDGGATWKLRLSNLPFGTQIKLAEGNAQTLYVGGIRTPLPYLARASTPNDTNVVQNGFRLQVSNDGGATWHTVPDVLQASIVQGWFVASNGSVFAYTGFSSQGGQPTAISGTATASTPVVAPAMTPQSGVVPSILAPTSFQTTPPPVSTATTTPVLQRYDPSSNVWSMVTKPPTSGIFMAVTPGDNSSNVLWFLETTNQQTTLYRFVA